MSELSRNPDQYGRIMEVFGALGWESNWCSKLNGLFCWSVEDKNSMCGGDLGQLVKSPREL